MSSNGKQNGNGKTDNGNGTSPLRDLVRSNQEIMHKVGSRLGDLNRFEQDLRTIRSDFDLQLQSTNNIQDGLVSWMNFSESAFKNQQQTIEELDDRIADLEQKLNAVADEQRQMVELHQKTLKAVTDKLNGFGQTLDKDQKAGERRESTLFWTFIIMAIVLVVAKYWLHNRITALENHVTSIAQQVTAASPESVPEQSPTKPNKQTKPSKLKK